MSDKKLRIAFAGGGSGGHLYPQVAVAGEIKKLAPDTEIFFVSTKGSIEEKLIPRSGYEVVLIPSGKLKGQGALGLVKTSVSLFLSVFVCFWVLLRRRPDLIFSAGGYAGAPFLVLGALMGVRCEILEQNRQPGLANRWMAKFCRRVYLNFAGSANLFGKKGVVVGHPCRPEIEKARWSAADEKTLIAVKPFRIFVFGGSQGAMGINRLITAASEFLKDLDIAIEHQTGEADYQRVVDSYKVAGFSNVRVEKFIYDMDRAFREAHIVVCRAGASSLAELAAAGKAAVLIPLVSKDRHQEHNAVEIEHEGGALSRLQGSLTGETLAAILKDLYNNPERIQSLAHQMGKLHHPNAAHAIAQSILAKQA